MLSQLHQQEEGMSLIEVMVGIVLLSIALIPILGYFINSTRMVNETEKNGMALNLAQQTVEEIKSVKFSNLETKANDLTEDVSLDEKLFNRNVTVANYDTDIKKITVKIYWNNGNSDVVLRTLISER